MQDVLERAATRRQGLAALAATALGAVALGAGWRSAGPAVASNEGEGGRCGPPCGDIAGPWSVVAEQAIGAGAAGGSPLALSRMLAMMHLAMHDAANAAAPRFAPHAFAARAAGADPTAAAAAAAHGVLAAFLPAQRPALDVALSRSVAEGGGPEIERGLALGTAAARAILADRADDGSDDRAEARVRYEPMTHLGAWQPTPGVETVLAPHWARLRPFALRSAAMFRVAAPPRVETAAYARAFAEVRQRGARHGAQRTADEGRNALFWADVPITAWNRAARAVAEQRGLDLWEGARLFALLNMALADAAIAAWESKLHHDFWRPITAIRTAAVDFNAATIPDRTWEPLLPTPPAQAHPSAHAALGAAAAEVLGRLLGEATPVAIAAPTALAGQPARSFGSFAAAALDGAESRVLGGVQFRFAVVDGLELGERVGRQVLASQLHPVGHGAA